jgi:hypothetical protein
MHLVAFEIPDGFLGPHRVLERDKVARKSLFIKENVLSDFLKEFYSEIN